MTSMTTKKRKPQADDDLSRSIRERMASRPAPVEPPPEPEQAEDLETGSRIAVSMPTSTADLARRLVGAIYLRDGALRSLGDVILEALERLQEHLEREGFKVPEKAPRLRRGPR